MDLKDIRDIQFYISLFDVFIVAISTPNDFHFAIFFFTLARITAKHVTAR